MTRGGTAAGKPPIPGRPGLLQQPKTRRRLAVAGVVLVVVWAYAWITGGSEAWIVVTPPADMRLTVGESQQVTVALKYKPPLLPRVSARSIAGTIQLISFPQAVDVAPTTVVSTAASPEAVMKVTGLRPGTEELDFAASNRPADQRSWQTTEIRVVVTR